MKAIDADRIVTLSSTEHHFLDAESRLQEEGRRALMEEVDAVRVDVLAPHFPRTPDWAARTESRVAALRGVLGQKALPVYLNEEQRARATEPAADDYLTAARGARRAGAAGWLFHTDAGYDLARQPLRASLRRAEREAVSRLGR
ncbi:MAG: hypothetical protein HY654_02860 [Acidobacteria bacterium]|nr:hypothetical protein [Acidobacteriota bacterium]